MLTSTISARIGLHIEKRMLRSYSLEDTAAYSVLKQIAKLYETGLHDFPRRVGAETENLALALVFAANRGRKVSRRKERVAVGKAHLIGIEVAARKVHAADAVVVLLDLPYSAVCSISKISGRDAS